MPLMTQFWQTLRPLRKVGKLRAGIDLPAFTADCGAVRCFDSTASYITVDDSAADLASEFTFHARVKSDDPWPIGDFVPIVGDSNHTYFADTFIGVGIYSGKVYVNMDESVFTVTSDVTLPAGEWIDIAVTWDGAIIKIYLNGVLDTSEAYAGVIAGITAWDIGNPYGNPYSMKISCLEAYTYAETAEDILYYQDKLAYVERDGLAWQFKFLEDDATVIDGSGYTNAVTGDAFAVTDPASPAADFPPIPLYGSAFIAAEFDLSAIDQDFSLVYPVGTALEDLNYVLAIRSVDEDGNVQRYKLLDTELSISPEPMLYTGQRLAGPTVVVEVWNIDGQTEVSSADVVRLLTSVMVAVTTSTQTTVTDLLEVTAANTLLAENFPLANFPLEFETQQQY